MNREVQSLSSRSKRRLNGAQKQERYISHTFDFTPRTRFFNWVYVNDLPQYLKQILLY